MLSLLRLASFLIMTAYTGLVFADDHSNSIAIDNFSFSPAELTIKAGTTVTWVNHDDIPHTVVDGAGTPAFHSSPLDTDQSWSYTFAKPGVYHYFCSIHPHMVGTITVK